MFLLPFLLPACHSYLCSWKEHDGYATHTDARERLMYVQCTASDREEECEKLKYLSQLIDGGIAVLAVRPQLPAPAQDFAYHRVAAASFHTCAACRVRFHTVSSESGALP